MSFCPWPETSADVVRLKQQTPNGQIKERYKGSGGFSELSYRIVLGRELLPDGLAGGCLLLVAGDQLMACFKSSMEAAAPYEAPPQMQQLPGPGIFELQPVISRSSQGLSSSAPASTDLDATVYAALSLVASGEADLLHASPFPAGDSLDVGIDLQTVITAVSNSCSALRFATLLLFTTAVHHARLSQDTGIRQPFALLSPAMPHISLRIAVTLTSQNMASVEPCSMPTAFCFVRAQVVAASRRVTRKEVSVSTAVADVCAELGVFDSSGSAVADEEAASSFKTLLARLLLRFDKDTAVRLTAAVLPFVENPMTGLDTSCYPTESGARSSTTATNDTKHPFMVV
jgi:hypothetical protein